MLVFIGDIIRKWTPPPIKKIKNYVLGTKPFVWFKLCNSWDIASTCSTGYDADNILEKCKASLIKVRDGQKVYERDSVLFENIDHSWGLLDGLEKAAINNSGKFCVLDFGGSLGSTYYQNRAFLNTLKQLRWCIVEQPNFVACGKEDFENETLKFYNTLEECLENNSPDVLVLSSVLQYLEKPAEWISKFIDMNVPYIIIDRTAFINDSRDRVAIQNVPEYIYKASYPCWFFNEEIFLKRFDQYSVTSEFDNSFDVPVEVNKYKAYWKGFLLTKNG